MIKFNPYDLSSRPGPVPQKSPPAAPPDAPPAPAAPPPPPPRPAPPGSPGVEVAVRGELTGPLNVFLGRCEMMLERSKTSGNADLFFELQKIYSNAKYLSTIITDSVIVKKSTLSFDVGTVAFHKPEDIQLPPKQGQSPKEAPAGKASLLLVDDDAVLLEMLGYYLEAQGFAITTARGGREALVALHTGQFDLMLVDLFMPEMDGYEFLSYVKNDLNWRDTPVIIFSGLRETETADRCLEMGAADYLIKPIDPVLLRTRINACLEQKRLAGLAQQKESAPAQTAAPAAPPPATAEAARPAETVLFASLPNLAGLSAHCPPETLGAVLQPLLASLRRISRQHQAADADKGDAVIRLGTLPGEAENHLETLAELTTAIGAEMDRLNEQHGTNFALQVTLKPFA